MGYMGFSLSRMADSRARAAEAKEQAPIDPLAPGEDPLAALDPETRELVTSLEPAPDPEAADGTTLGDRIGGGLVGAGIGAFAGAMIANWTPRSQRYVGAGPMNVAATLTFAGIGAAIGGIAGFSRGRNPIERDAREHARSMLPAAARSPQSTQTGPAHEAFAGLYAIAPPSVVHPATTSALAPMPAAETQVAG